MSVVLSASHTCICCYNTDSVYTIVLPWHPLACIWQAKRPAPVAWASEQATEWHHGATRATKAESSIVIMRTYGMRLMNDMLSIGTATLVAHGPK